MKILSGRESSIIALLAMSKGLSKSDKKRILKELSGEAFLIAKCVLNEYLGRNKEIIEVSEGFIEWVKSLKPIKYRK